MRTGFAGPMAATWDGRRQQRAGCLRGGFGVERLEGRVLLAADPILTWNEVAMDTLRANQVNLGPTWASRNMAIMHAAMFDAVNAVYGKYKPYLVELAAPANTSVEAAAAAAAHRALEALYPAQEAALDAKLADYLAGIPDNVRKTNGIQVGRQVAGQILAARQNDGSSAPVSYTPGTDPGDWRPTPPDYTSALGPGWGDVTPFTMTSASQFLPPAPPAMTSAAYTAAYNQVKSLGELNSAARTAEQTEIGYFWAYDRREMGTPLVLYNQATAVLAQQQHNTTLENARLFALVNLAMGDAGINCWHCKYKYDLWRPVTGIQEGATDGNPDTAGDTSWQPLGAPGGAGGVDFTPPFPAYTSGHATFGAATFRVLERFYGKNNIQFTMGSDELPGATRTFDSFSQASDENAISRIYLGIHWLFDAEQGIAAGKKVADWVYGHALAPKAPGSRPYRPPLATPAAAVGGNGQNGATPAQLTAVKPAGSPYPFSTTAVRAMDELLGEKPAKVVL